MEKKKLQTKQKRSVPVLRKEILRRLNESELQVAAGGGRLRVPVGYADDTTPIYSDEDQP